MGPRLLLIVGGNAGAGKDSFGNFMAQRLQALSTSVRLDSYAWALKQIVHLKYGVPLHILNATKEVKESAVYYGKTVRQLLQYEGQRAREECGPTVWADRLLDRVRLQSEQVAIITDARHPPEEIVGMRTSASPARVVALRVVNPHVPITRGHPSEDLIADASDDIFDFIVTNDGTIGELAVKARDHVDAVLVLDQIGASKVTPKLMAYSVGPDGWPYPSAADAEAVGRGGAQAIVERSFTHLCGPIVRSTKAKAPV